MPKWDNFFECTLSMIAKVLSRLSCRTLHMCSGIYTSTDSSIMWFSMEKFLSWMRVIECEIFFWSASMVGRIIFWISTNVDLTLSSSLRNSTCLLVKNLIFLKWVKIELGSSCNCYALALRSSSILDNFSFISLVKLGTSHSLPKSTDALVQDILEYPKL